MSTCLNFVSDYSGVGDWQRDERESISGGKGRATTDRGRLQPAAFHPHVLRSLDREVYIYYYIS
ncbi:hypothetical protein C0Q70_13358 [Pomacea canaliculata]|uniref:Uncharacterized protein n=1 Tax=Pomacea canaliculata TaxID=400727 RepID=A0A2T7NX06_POMCA|nr:hypothetical protein C0Q70_13358 [Pomacea canaliculata]